MEAAATRGLQAVRNTPCLLAGIAGQPPQTQTDSDNCGQINRETVETSSTSQPARRTARGSCRSSVTITQVSHLTFVADTWSHLIMRGNLRFERKHFKAVSRDPSLPKSGMDLKNSGLEYWTGNVTVQHFFQVAT